MYTDQKMEGQMVMITHWFTNNSQRLGTTVKLLVLCVKSNVPISLLNQHFSPVMDTE